MSDGCTAFYFGKQRLGPDLTMDSQCVRDIIQGKKEQADLLRPGWCLFTFLRSVLKLMGTQAS